jgi:hypothetical protein
VIGKDDKKETVNFPAIMLASAFFYPSVMLSCFKLNFCYQNYCPVNKDVQISFQISEGDELERIDGANVSFFYLQGLYLDNANYSLEQYCLEESDKQVVVVVVEVLDQRFASI